MIQVRLSHLLAIVGFFVTFYLLTALSDILLPFVLGFALAYFLDPLADRLEAVGVRRSLATLTITVIVGLALLTALAFGLPVLAQQISMLIAALPGYISDVQVWLLEQNLVEGQNELVSVMGESLLAGLQKTASSMVLTGLSLINLLALIFITPIVAVYMLNDWDHMVARINGLLPDEQAAIIRNLASQIDETLGGFARGQILVCLSLGTIYAVGLSLVGLQSGIIVGVFAGLISFIPYVGAAFGLVLAGALGLGQFGFELPPLALIAGVFFVGQFIEGNILTPRLVGDRVKLHPVWIIFALLAMGSLFGFLGLLLAVPLAAIIGVLVRYGVTLYMRDYVNRSDNG
ncbi:AI-2E family transporter [Alphaproteobacteria bacterium]|jgi:predicted PurR-regulated permease PerM|nr:AI-2E family transporter [Alphaproteobacteria bacterium]MDB2523459.1 AI-2E family transporter [Alphaproteobacteria bacterium]MDB2641357.1 AI-2E family transporter [Alphaproteobacteria bacterium]HCL48969.1 AI-2E family transporter [Rhodobiaceae bacterium]